MFLDIFLLILLVLATYTGYKKGLIVGVFSLAAIIVGLAAAMKLSVVAAAYLRSYFSWEGKWVPPLSFLLVLVGVLLLIRLGANALEKGAQLISLGWINALGGILFYWAICLVSCSIILFYLSQIPLIPTTAIEQSITYPYLKEIGPWVMDCFAKLFPVFRGMYQQLQDFFEKVKEQIPMP
ncbi:MAG: CvpA family protein [Bacteroidetes bacterium]|nr:CvpA family protein [Bacteroidota bacterium]